MDFQRNSRKNLRLEIVIKSVLLEKFDKLWLDVRDVDERWKIKEKDFAHYPVII